jgi:rod shape determining protein RodA
LNQIIKAGVICGIPIGLILLQPDMGTALTYMPILGIGVLLRGVNPKAIAVVILILLLIVPLSWHVLKDLLTEHQTENILTFIDPSRDPQGKGFQVQQSKIAIGSGGLLGKGIFKGSQSQLGFLPARHTDFIFSVVGEEMGSSGFWQRSDCLPSFCSVRFTTLRQPGTAWVFSLFWELSGCISFTWSSMLRWSSGSFPVIGIPLPFMSYGGSSVLTAFIGLGLVISVRRRRYVN